MPGEKPRDYGKSNSRTTARPDLEHGGVPLDPNGSKGGKVVGSNVTFLARCSYCGCQPCNCED